MKQDFYAPILRPPSGCSEPRRVSLHRVGAYSVVAISTVAFVALPSTGYDAPVVLLVLGLLGPMPLLVFAIDRIRLCVSRPRWVVRPGQYRDAGIV
jgi:hypothetical protein